MTVRDSDTLKSYFTLTKVMPPSNYVDLIDTIFAQGAAGVDGDHNHDDRYVQLSIANTISATHLFSPTTYSPPFVLGSNAQGQTVIGLKADQLNKSISVSGLGLSGGGDFTIDRTITLTSNSNPGPTPSILATDANGFLNLLRLNVDVLADKSGANLTLSPTGNVSLDPGGNYVLPLINYDINLGSINKKYLTLHAAELWVETLVAQNTIATIGGRILIGPTTTLTSNLSNGILMNNIGFETAGTGGVDVFSDWTEVANLGTIVQDNTIYHNGLYSCKLTSAATAPEVQQNVLGGVAEGITYTIIFWTRGDGTNAGRYAIYDVTHSSYITVATSTNIIATTWTRLAVAFTAPTGTTIARIDFLGPVANGGIAWFDDIYVYYSTISVKHNEMAVDDISYMEAAGSLEFFKVITAPSGSGPYMYGVIRDLDGTGANVWYAGDAVFNSGTTGEGFMDLYSIRGIKGRIDGTTNDYGPTIVGNVRFGVGYNEWTEHWAIGNLNGLYGIGTNTYGFAAGKYADNESFITVDAANGIRMQSRASGVNTVRAQWDVSGNILIGATGSSQDNIYISAGALSIRNNTTERIGMTAAGVLTIKDGVGNAVITLDASTGAEITKKLTMPGVDSAISIGTTPPASNSSGTGLYLDRTGMYGLLTSILQIKFDATTGAITAGQGAVTLNANGINVAAYTDYAVNRAYTISNLAGVATSFYGYYNLSQMTSWTILRAESQTNYSPRLIISASCPAGQDANVTISVEGYSSFSSSKSTTGEYTNTIMAGTTYVIGKMQFDHDVINNATYLRFQHGLETGSDDGKIGAGMFAEGLNIVGIQTATAAGRKIHMWGTTILEGSFETTGAAQIDSNLTVVGDLYSYKNSSFYNVYGFHPFTTPLTSTSWDGDSYSTTSKTLIDLSAVFSGVPAGVKAVLIYVLVNDSGSSTTDCYMIFGPTNSSGVGPAVNTGRAPADYKNSVMLTIPCDANGDIYYQINASGASTFDVTIQIWGYWI
jgi:hypothetical protein